MTLWIITVLSVLFGLACVGALMAVSLGASKIVAENEALKAELKAWTGASSSVVRVTAEELREQIANGSASYTMPQGRFGEHES